MKRIITFVLIIAVMITMTPVSFASKLSEAEKKKQQLEAQLNAAKDAVKDIQSSKYSIENKLEALDGQLSKLSNELEKTEQSIASVNKEIAKTEKELEEAERVQKKQYEDMKKRIQFMYENKSSMNYLQVVLTSDDMPSMLNKVEYLQQVSKADRKLMDEYVKTEETIKNKKEELDRKKSALVASMEHAKSQKEAVEMVSVAKEKELGEVREELTEAERKAKVYAEEVKEQALIVAQIKEIEKQNQAMQNQYNGGKFKWPCPSSTRITSDFGPRKSPVAGATTFHMGIDIGASYGAAIVAAADGVVMRATYSSIMGNYVMISHGGGLYTYYEHASQLLVSPNDKVKAGQTIAKIGSTGVSTGNHLHFGVYEKGGFVTPWKYLSR